jgi:hypothetical protein
MVKNSKPDENRQPRHRVKQSVTQGIHLQAGNCIYWVHTAKHVMPLKDLMQENSIEEATHPNAEDDARQFDRKHLTIRYGHTFSFTPQAAIQNPKFLATNGLCDTARALKAEQTGCWKLDTP